jgi:hypothetical protein
MGLMCLLQVLEAGQQLPRFHHQRYSPDPLKACNDDPLLFNMRGSLADVPLHHLKLGLASGHSRSVAS